MSKSGSGLSEAEIANLIDYEDLNASDEDEGSDFEVVENLMEVDDELCDQSTPEDDTVSSGTKVLAALNWEETSDDIIDFGIDISSGYLLPQSFDVATADPIDYFELFFTTEFYATISFETNSYAEIILNKIERPLTRTHRMNYWFPTSTDEIKQFFGLCILMGLWNLPSIENYWNKKGIYKNYAFNNVMSGKRFRLLLSMLHFSSKDAQSSNDPLAKLRDITEYLRSKYIETMVPGTEIAIDESLVQWRGRLSFRQYIKNKRKKYGIKIYKICTPDGYVLNFLVYVGAKTLESQPGESKTAILVKKLMEPYINKGHELYMDNYYNSVQLCLDMVQLKTHVVGTLRKDRKLNPKEVVDKKLKVGEVFWKRHDCVRITKWKDKKDIIMISTKHNHQMVDSKNKRGDVKKKPLVVMEYNKFMGGVDLSDQFCSYESIQRRTLKWYKKLFFFFVDTSVTNAFLVAKGVNPDKFRSLSIVKFRENLVERMCPQILQEKLTPTTKISSNKLKAHYLAPIASTVKKAQPYKRCRQCQKQEIRKESRYCCTQCEENPALSPNGLAAIGCGTEVVILDTHTLNVLECFSSVHKSSITHVSWNPFGRPFLPEKPDKQPPDIISVDTSNLIIIWDIEKGQSISSFLHPDSKTLLDLKWANGFEQSQKSKIFLLYSSNLIVVLDVMTLSFQNICIVDSPSSTLDCSLFSFDVDPFCSSHSTNLALLTEHSLYFVQNWDPLKKQEKIIVSGKMSLKIRDNSPNPSPSSSELSKRHNSTSGIRKLVSEFVGTDYPLIPGQVYVKPEGTILYHHNMKDHLIISNSTHILFINTHFKVVLCTYSIDRSASPLIQVIPTKQSPAVITLHENGTIYLRKYVISGNHQLSVSLETICASDQPRFSSKKSEILGIMLNPTTENCAILYLSDGRYIQYEIISSNKILEQALTDKIKKHLMTPITPSISMEGFKGVAEDSLKNDITKSADVDRQQLGKLMQNILEQETENTVQLKLKKASPLIGSLTCISSRPSLQLLVAGTSQGFILVFKILGEGENYRCEILKRFSVHSNTPVCGIEFLADDEIISFANLSFSANPKCEMILTHLWTGASKTLKQDDQFHIGFVKVSPLKQYFILAYKNGMAPCELWDVNRRQLIKTLPSKLPSITCATWKHSSDTTKDETFYMTDLGTFLFTFRVEGNRFSSATCVKLDTAGNTGGIPVSLVSKGKLVFRGDSSGTLVIYDTEKKTASSGVSIGRGPLLKIEAGEGMYDGLFIAQFNEQVELWDLMEVKKLRSLHNGRHFKAADVCWMNGYLATIPRNSGGIKFLSIDEPQKKLACGKTYGLKTSFLPADQKCQRLIQLINSPTNQESIYNFFEDLCAFDEAKLWSVFLSSIKHTRWTQREYGFNLFSDNKSYKEIVVKLAQSVWFCDIEKREDVAKVLLWTGEHEKAAEILLDTEPSGAIKYISNGLKAGLCVGSNNLPEATKAVLKIIATNLIACGEIDEGLEILCLLSKHSEAVKYLESSNDWARAILLSKTSLNDKQSHETLAKYGQFLNTHRHVIRSACVYASIGRYDRTIEVLFGGRKRHLSYLLLTFCDKHGIELPNLANHVRLSIQLDFARFIFECGLMNEALSFCDSIGDEAKDLRSELEILSS